MNYQFTDSDLAARRLGYLAAVFESSTRQFVAASPAGSPELVIDLGCGPGHTTRLLAEVTGCRRVIGLDSSSSFLEAARKTATDRVRFCHGDATVVPFPVGPADLMYCRFLLTHLPHPVSVMEKWASQLVPDGRLLVEEIEWIRTQSCLFSEYLDIVGRMLASQSQDMYIGLALHAARIPGMSQTHSSVRQVTVPCDQVATMFHMNIQSWKHQDFIRQNYSAEQIAALETHLRNVRELNTTTGSVTWGLRQMVYTVWSGEADAGNDHPTP